MIFPTVMEAIEMTTITIWNPYVISTFIANSNLYKAAIATTFARVLIVAVVKAGEP